MSNGSITELIAKGKLDEDTIDINNKKSIFDFNIDKRNKYSKGDTLFYPEGRANWGNTFRFNIEKKGDLLYDLYLVVKLPKLSISNLNTNIKQNETNPNSIYRVKYTDYIGNVLVEKASLYINGQLIDELEGEYMQLYTDLYTSDWNRKSMLGTDDHLNQPNLKIDSEYIYIPLKFWFCNDYTKPLPIVALQYSDIYIDIKFRNFNNCVNVLELDGNDNIYHSDKYHYEVPIEGVHLQANFYYVDLEERKSLATKEYEILINQSQVRTIPISSSSVLEINFNHIVKDLIFFIQPSKHKENGEFFNLTGKMLNPPSELNPLSSNQYKVWNLEPERHLLNRARILLNGMERVEWRDAKYYYYMQNHENYRNTIHTYIYLYSFNSNPTKNTNFSGLNFSRIDNAQLQVEIKQNKFNLGNGVYYPSYNDLTLKCYATNYNILVIKNGLAGVKYTT